VRIATALRSLTPRQAIGLAALALLVLATAAFIVTRPDDDDVALRTESDSSTTTEESTTTTETVTTTTEAPTTTAVVTTAPPATEPPATAPPTTAAPPSTGRLDMPAVLALAKANATRGTPPQTFTGAKVCPAAIDRPSDAGDDSIRDIGDWYLARYCDGTYRFVLGTDAEDPLHSFWAELDTGPGGCGGIDRVVIGWHEPSDQSIRGRGDAAGFPVFNGGWLQLDFRQSAIGSPHSFLWRGAARGAGEGDAGIDKVPNSGPERFAF
jgi:hypothetical protein